MIQKKQVVRITISLILLICIALGLFLAYRSQKEKQTQLQQARSFDATMYCYEVSISGVPLGKCEPFQLKGESRWTYPEDSNKKERSICLQGWETDCFHFPAQESSIYETLSDAAFTVRILRGSSVGGYTVGGSVLGLTEAFDGCVIITNGHYFVGSTNPDFDVEDVLQYFPDLPKLLPEN